MNKEIVWNAVKEPTRLLVLSILPLLITYFTELGVEWAAAAIVLLRFVDKLLHEYGKETKNQVLTKGLTQF